MYYKAGWLTPLGLVMSVLFPLFAVGFAVTLLVPATCVGAMACGFPRVAVTCLCGKLMASCVGACISVCDSVPLVFLWLACCHLWLRECQPWHWPIVLSGLLVSPMVVPCPCVTGCRPLHWVGRQLLMGIDCCLHIVCCVGSITRIYRGITRCFCVTSCVVVD